MTLMQVVVQLRTMFVLAGISARKWQTDFAGQTAGEAAGHRTPCADLLTDGAHVGHLGGVSAVQKLPLPGELSAIRLLECCRTHRDICVCIALSLVYMETLMGKGDLTYMRIVRQIWKMKYSSFVVVVVF